MRCLLASCTILCAARERRGTIPSACPSSTWASAASVPPSAPSPLQLHAYPAAISRPLRVSHMRAACTDPYARARTRPGSRVQQRHACRAAGLWRNDSMLGGRTARSRRRQGRGHGGGHAHLTSALPCDAEHGRRLKHGGASLAVSLGFPTQWVWWVTMVAGTLVMGGLGELSCYYIRDMRDIELDH